MKKKCDGMNRPVVILRIRVGRYEVEATGPKQWVEKQIAKIIKRAKEDKP